MTEIEQPPQNGIDLSAAEDDDHNKSRPADIEQDMREMERRKRVEAIMGSRLFREELERIVDSARDGGASGILQQLSDIVGLPASRVGSVFKASNCMMPINDIRGVESMGYAKGEKILRCKLAATFRLLDLYGWTQGLGAQITARLKVDQEYFLVNPFGLLYHEVTASSLNKIDMQGQIVEQGTTNFGVNKNQFVLHSIVHAARPDIRCAIYIGCSAVVAISSLKTGLLPITKDACVLGDISTHPYSGSLLDDDERNRLVRNLGPNSKVMLLTNHGALCCGETIEEAFFAVCSIVRACETQLKLLPVGLDNLQLIPEESRKVLYDQARRPPQDLEKKFAAVSTEDGAPVEGENNKEATTLRSTAPKWRVGGAEFEALMRMLDNAGYRTGYIYRHPLIKSDPPKPKNDVELPPAVSSLGYLLEEEELFRQGIWKKGDLRKGGDRSRWLNSPNVYQKVEVLETGTPDPKKITKWVAEGSPTHSTPIRIEDPLQFVPGGTTTKEFKRLQQQIKDNRRADKISAGPQSHILEGVTWDEANRIKDATVSSAGDHVVLMGAASKGIIQRGYQHNATVYKAPYAKNPFDNVTDDEINDYKRTVERKKKSIHGEYTDTDFSESEALSSLQTSGAQHTKQTTTTTAAVSQSEPEDISEHQVMRIQTQQAPVPSQPEVVLSDASQAIPIGNAGLLHVVQAQVHQSAAADVVSHEANSCRTVPNPGVSLSFIAELTARLSARERRRFATPPASDEDLYVAMQTDDYDIAIEPADYLLQEQPSVSQCCECHQQQPTNGAENCEHLQQQHIYEEIGETSASLEVLTGCKRCADGIYKKSRCCNTPAVCEGIFASMRKPIENNLILKVPFMPDSPTRQELTLKPRSNKASSKQNAVPHRTNWHYGFNSPKIKPAPDHKHIPSATEPQKYVPLGKATSYEEFFSSPRYVDLCDHCFEKLLRFKPDIVNVRARLRNLCHMDDVNRATHYDYADLSSSEGSACLCAPPPNSRDEPMDNESTVSNSSFLQKIQRMNYSEESANSNFQPSHLVNSNISLIEETKDNTHARPLAAISEDLYESSQSLNAVASGTGQQQYNAIVTEIWEFGDWQNEGGTLDDQTEADKSLTPEDARTESVESIHRAQQAVVPLHVRYAEALNDTNTRRRLCFENQGDHTEASKEKPDNDQKHALMSRQQRNQRTAEFHELWDDHISAKNPDNEDEARSSDSETEPGYESPFIKPISVRIECKNVVLEETKKQSCQVRFNVQHGVVQKTTKLSIEDALKNGPVELFDDENQLQENVCHEFFREENEAEISAADTVLPGTGVLCVELDVTNYIDDTKSFVALDEKDVLDEKNAKSDHAMPSKDGQVTNEENEAKIPEVLEGNADEMAVTDFINEIIDTIRMSEAHEQSMTAGINGSVVDNNNSGSFDGDTSASMNTLVNLSNQDCNATSAMDASQSVDPGLNADMEGAVGYAEDSYASLAMGVNESQDEEGAVGYGKDASLSLHTNQSQVHGLAVDIDPVEGSNIKTMEYYDESLTLRTDDGFGGVRAGLRTMFANPLGSQDLNEDAWPLKIRSATHTLFHDPSDLDSAIAVLEGKIDLNQPLRPSPFDNITTVFVNDLFKNLQLEDRQDKDSFCNEPSDTEKGQYIFDDTGNDADEDTPDKNGKLENRPSAISKNKLGLLRPRPSHQDYKMRPLSPSPLAHNPSSQAQPPTVRQKRKYKKTTTQNENEMQTYSRMHKYWEHNENLEKIKSKNFQQQDEDADDDSHLNSLERTILKNIEVHELKKSDQIYVKIEQTIRNKLTPSRLESLLEQEKRGGNSSWEDCAPSTSHAQGTGKHVSPLGNKRRAVSKCARPQAPAPAKPLRRSKSLGRERKPADVLEVNEKLSKTTSPRKSRLDTRHKRRMPEAQALRAAIGLRNSPTTITGKRNFILENIRNAAMPRTQSASSRKYGSPTIVSGPSPPGSPERKKRNTVNDDDCTVYSFQANVVGSSPKLWLSMQPNTPRQLQAKKNHNIKRRKHNRGLFGKATPHKSPLRLMNEEATNDHNENTDNIESTDNTEPMDGAYALTRSPSAQTFTIESDACMDMNVLSESISTLTLDSDKKSGKENWGIFGASTSTSTFIVRATPGCSDRRLQRPTIDYEELSVGRGLDRLGERLQEIQPRLESYKLNVEDYGGHVEKCARAIDECMAIQAEIAEDQLRFRDALLLSEANEADHSHANSISETED